MADEAPRSDWTRMPETLPAREAPAEDAWAGEDDPWLELLREDESESPLGLLRIVLISALLGALVWTAIGLTLYRLVVA